MTADRPVAVLVLAAGGGTRMKSATPKVLHTIGGRTLLGHVLHAARGLAPDHLVVVVRHQRDLVAPHVGELDPAAIVADQDEIAGTGRATQCGLQALPGDVSGTVLVTYGDVPLQTTQTLGSLIATHQSGGQRCHGAHRQACQPVRLRARPARRRRRRQRDRGRRRYRRATGGQEVNSGILRLRRRLPATALGRIGTDNAAGEVYLTDVVAIAAEDGRRVGGLQATDLWQTEGVNTRAQLANLGRELNRRELERWMSEGVEVIDPATTWVDVTVELAADVTLKPGVQLHGSTRVETSAVIGPDTTLTDVQVGAGASVVRTHGVGAVIGERCSVGPFACLRAGTVLGTDGKRSARSSRRRTPASPKG